MVKDTNESYNDVQSFGEICFLGCHVKFDVLKTLPQPGHFPGFLLVEAFSKLKPHWSIY